jgi:CHAT domain-containing protein
MARINRPFFTAPPSLTSRSIGLFGLILVHIAAAPARSQEIDSFQAEKSAAYSQFHHGKARQAIAAVRALADRAPNVVERVMLQRDLLEMCATASDWKCVYDTLIPMVPLVNSDPKLAPLRPDMRLYTVKLLLFLNDTSRLQEFLRPGPFNLVPPSRYLEHAELQLALHDLYIRGDDYRAAEGAFATATISTLLSDPQAAYQLSKVLVDMISALLHAYDIIGAWSLWAQSEAFISKSVPHDGIVYARHRLLTGQLYAYTDAFADTAAILSEAVDLTTALEIDEDSKAYQASISNALATAAFVLANKPEEAKRNHAKSPMQSQKESTLRRAEFQSYTEFYFAVADVFLAAVSRTKPDARWKILFEKEPKWQLGAIALAEINSYRSFALGVLAVADSRLDEGRRLLAAAAKQRIDLFESVMRRNFEGFQTANLVDRIIIHLGLSAALKLDDPATGDLLLRASEILNRNIRHSVADAAVLVRSQESEEARKVAQAYLHLRQQKREWELNKRLTLLATGSLLQDKDSIAAEYSEMVSRLSEIKKRFQLRRSVEVAQTLPTMQELQRSLGPKDVFVAVFPTVAGVGKLCVGKDRTAYSEASERADDVSKNIRLLQFATTADHPPDPVLDAQYPVSSAIFLRNTLFGGFEKCLVPGGNVIISLPRIFADVPLGALLSEAPVSNGRGGYDLSRARWLIKEFSFSLVISSRQHIAAARNRGSTVAARPFLGVGDPVFSTARLAQLDPSTGVGGSAARGPGTLDFAEIPETREELSKVAQVLGVPGSDVLLGKAATEAALRKKPLSEYDVIHFATHGVMAREVPELDESALLLSSGATADPDNDGVLSASEISKLSLNARLVVLSACNTAKYDMRRVTLGVHDLHAAFAVAGVPALFASLWPIDSSTARDLTVLFFQKWRSERIGGAAASLAEATRSFLEKADAAHQHPRFWSSFVIVGYGGVLGGTETAANRAQPAFEPVGEGAGTIVHAIAGSRFLLLSTNVDWDGSRMANVISRQGENGRQDWSLSSRDVVAEKLAVAGDRIYAAGHTIDPNPVPVMRQLDLNGRLLWKSELSHLRGYVFADFVMADDGILAVATPVSRPPDQGLPPKPSPAVLLRIDRLGKVRKEVSFQGNDGGLVRGRQALILKLGRSVIVAVNRGTTSQEASVEKSIFGLPQACHDGAAVRLLQFDGVELKIVRNETIPGFQVGAVGALVGISILRARPSTIARIAGKRRCIG